MCETNGEWLERSLIGEGLKPLNVVEVSTKPEQAGLRHENVTALDSYTVVITFKTKEDMESAVSSESKEILKIVDDVRTWSREE